MFCVEKCKWIAKYSLFSFLCFDAVLTSPTETAQRLENGENGTTIQLGYSRFPDSKDLEFILYVVVFVGILLYLLIKCLCQTICKVCCSVDCDSPPPSRRASTGATVHPPPRGQNTNSREQGTRNVFSEFNSSGGGLSATGGTVSFINPYYASAPQYITELDGQVTDKPPDYSLVALNDLVSPTRPAFPVVQKEKETPPPEYEKGNKF